ncbi:hypothetical protein FTUN_3313 [Frigoriglobus tundricola]|uniref:Uncharacterized protein n=1 Tax=Frigoriglobus tundricola TaxID=2774151 RepID=A0A6M5YNU7_9BACT|nr:hypothetical protein FTUN_3313 [Frigoriglobus tundricola]
MRTRAGAIGSLRPGDVISSPGGCRSRAAGLAPQYTPAGRCEMLR